MKRILNLISALLLFQLAEAQTTVSLSLNKTDFCPGDSLIATITFNRPSNAKYTGFYGFYPGNVISGYTDYSPYNPSNAGSGTVKITRGFLGTSDTVFTITVGDSLTAGPPWTIEKKYSISFKVHNRPIAHFTYLNPKEQCENRGMHFNLHSFLDSSICPPGSFIVQRYWYFGDGNADAPGAAAANHSYNYDFSGDSANNYIVSLKVVDNFGCTDSTLEPGFTTHPVPVAKPTLAGNPVQCLKENQFNFIDSSFFVANTSESLFRKWTFEPTDSSFNASSAKHYALAGIHYVKLVCFTSSGCGDTSSLLVTVKPAPEPLSISGAQSVISWSAHTYSVINTNGSTYNWSVDNGIVSSGNGSNSVTIQWNNALSGNVQVRETNADGCTGDSSVLPVQINPNSIGGTNTSIRSFCYPNPASHTLLLRNPATGTAQLKISNLTGEIMYQRFIDGNGQIELPVAAWKEGIYLVQVSNANYSGIQKIVIIR